MPLINKHGFTNGLNFTENRPFSVDEFAARFTPSTASAIFANTKSIELLETNLSIDEFKKEWAKNTLNERFGLILNNEDTTNAINILNELLKQKEEQNRPKTDYFKPIQATSKSKTYKDESTSELKKFYEFIKKEFESGKNTFEILKSIAESRVDKKI